jgi:hypothetical protein
MTITIDRQMGNKVTQPTPSSNHQASKSSSDVDSQVIQQSVSLFERRFILFEIERDSLFESGANH